MYLHEWIKEGTEIFRRENLTELEGVEFHPELLAHLSWGDSGKLGSKSPLR